jgi:hypothetical protein
MKIAALLNVHEDNEIVQDTLDSIRTYMTNDILILTDGAAHWKTKTLRGGAEILLRDEPFEDMDVTRIEGLYHACTKSPFRNMTLGYKTLIDNWKDADWYCYIEYDCLVASSDFKKDLEEANRRGVWMIGNDHRCGNYKLPLVEKVVRRKIGESHVLLGCCVFIHREYARALMQIDFFDRFLSYTNPFRETIPGFDEQGAYDLGEVVYPTLASHLGGRVEEFACFNHMIGWTGKAERFPMRFRPDLTAEFPDASILHPLKNYDHPIRAYYRERRKRQKKWKTFLNKSQESLA